MGKFQSFKEEAEEKLNRELTLVELKFLQWVYIRHTEEVLAKVCT